MPKLHVVFCSVREGRQGLPVAKWFLDKAVAHGKFECRLVDLEEVNLPLLDEPNHPMKRLYTKDHTKAWSATVAEADAYAFVTPEYNYSMAPALLNALDFLYHEWSYKPCGFVSYGGVSGGLRSAQHAKSVMTSFKMMPIPEGVSLQFFARSIDASGTFAPGDLHDQSVKSMLDELGRWSDALVTLRS